MSTVTVRSFEIVRVETARARRDQDRVAVELPLEVRLNSQPFAVIMRTPGADDALALGFLLTEGVIGGLDDIERIDLDEMESVINVWLAPGHDAALSHALGQRREVMMNSSCGMCGRRSLEALKLDRPPFTDRWSVESRVLLGLPSTLAAAQPAFAETGGLHAAGLFDRAGHLVASEEDVGRHNAVDKLLGRMLRERRLPLDDLLLFVSGRTSFEIVQKAWVGGVRLVAGISAPSSLAIDLARTAGITLLGFVREDRCNAYAHDTRIATAPPNDGRD